MDNKGVDDPDAIAQLERIFEIAGLETKWASLIADWIDVDTVPLPSGGEDSLYLSQNPPYRPPIWRSRASSELLALPGFGRDNYLKVEPYLTALPRATPLNLCTARERYSIRCSKRSGNTVSIQTVWQRIEMRAVFRPKR